VYKKVKKNDQKIFQKIKKVVKTVYIKKRVAWMLKFASGDMCEADENKSARMGSQAEYPKPKAQAKGKRSQG